jgi:hypothetical protein
MSQLRAVRARAWGSISEKLAGPPSQVSAEAALLGGDDSGHGECGVHNLTLFSVSVRRRFCMIVSNSLVD